MSEITNCATSDLDFFSPPLYQNMIEKSITTYHAADLKEDRIVNIQVAKSEQFIDLCKTELYVQLKIFKTPTDGSTTEAALTATSDTQITVVNNLLSSLFKQVDLCLNNSMVESKLNYGQLAYMRDLLNFSVEKKNSVLQSQGWFTDTFGQMDNIVIVGTGENGTAGANQKFNEGAVRRRLLLNNGTIDLQGPLHLDFFNNGKFLVDGIDLSLKLTMADEAFFLLGIPGYSARIIKAGLFLKKIFPNPSVINSMNQMLSKKPISYSVNSSKLFTKKLETGGFTEELILCTGKVPKTLIIALGDHQSAITGNIAKNPFNYHHYKLTDVRLTVAGVPIPYAAPLKFNFEKDEYLSGYRTLDHANKSIFGNGITRAEYKAGFMLIIFDLTSNGECDSYREIDKSGEVVIHLTFAETTNNKLALICYTEQNETIEFDSFRNVINLTVKK